MISQSEITVCYRRHVPIRSFKDRLVITSVPSIVGRFLWSNDMKSEKRCSKCMVTKPIEMFSRNKSRRDGRSSRCRACSADDRRKFKEKNLSYIPKTIQPADPKMERKREQSRRYYADHREEIAKKRKTAYMNNPKKMKARDIAKHALWSGKIRQRPCAVCGATNQIDAHHDDYSKPLEVIWLCRSCHLKLHAKLIKQ